VAEPLQVAGDAAFATAEIQRPSSRRRDEVEENLSMEEPVAVVMRLTRPRDPFARMLLPRRAETRGISARPL
jgi:hypothetical protein